MVEEQKAPAPEGTAAPAEGGATAAPATKKRKMMLIVSGALAVVGIILALGVVFFLGGNEKKAAEGEHKPAEGGTEINPLTVYDVPEFTLNLQGDEPGGQHFLKLKIALEMANEADKTNVEMLLPRLQDDWGGFLRQLRPSDFQGTGNLHRLREALLRRANQSLHPLPVKAVYIRDLLVQ